MFENHLKIAFRHLKRRPLYTFINIMGLAVGMGCCLLVGLYVQDELSFDRFHAHADRLVQIGIDGPSGRNSSLPYPLASTLEAEVPEVERVVRVGSGGWLVLGKDEMHINPRVRLADANFFEVFSFPLLRGDPSTVLAAPDAAVITETLASTLFGEEDPIGQTLQVRRYDDTLSVTVRGVAEDAPANTTLVFDVVTSIQLLSEDRRDPAGWGSFFLRTYVQLEEGAPLAAFTEKMQAVLQPHYEGGAYLRTLPTFFAVPLPTVYLSDLYRTAGFQGQKRYLYIFISVALLILLIAAINYVNLVTALAPQRAREVGMRKTLGAGFFQLVRQFLIEAVLLSLAALVGAFLLTELALPFFNAVFEKELSLDFTGQAGWMLSLVAFVLLVGIASGSYPAFVLSRFQAVRVLRGGDLGTGRSRGLLRKGLVVVQFTFSIALIIVMSVIHRQLGYIQDKNLGFDGEQVVVVELNEEAWRLRAQLKQDALTLQGVERATVANVLPGTRFAVRIGYWPDGVTPGPANADKVVQFAPGVVDASFIETLSLRLLAGRDFDPRRPTDQTRAYILNETFVKQLGWTSEEAVGKAFNYGEGSNGEVIGVVEDFHLESLHDEIDPVSLHLREDGRWSASGKLIVKLAPGGLRGTMASLEQLADQYMPSAPFNYQFLDDAIDAMYRTERRLSRIFTTFALLAVFIACLGLFGLSAYAAEARTKEIGIRKALGATAESIVVLLSKDVLSLVVIAFVLAVPIAYLVMQRWLEAFAYRIGLTPGIFLLTGALALLIALLTVSYQAVRAATADPVESLRYE